LRSVFKLSVEEDGSLVPPSVGSELRSRGTRGRPRDPKVGEAILAAALDLLTEVGYSRLTIEGVALRAGVAKTSLYRRWPTRESLILDAVEKLGLAERPEVPDTGTLRRDMLAYLRAWIQFRHAQAWTSEVLANAELKDFFRKQLGTGLTFGFRTIVERAVERGELRPDTDVELMAALPIALVHQNYVVTGEPADEGLVRRIVDQFFNPAGKALRC
jgi:AcrR family transcriptional regulator